MAAGWRRISLGAEGPGFNSGAEGPRVQIAAATLSGNSLRQTVHTHCASVHHAAKLVAAFLRVVGVTAGLAESNGSLRPGLWLTSPAGCLPRTGIISGTLRCVIEYGLPLPFYHKITMVGHDEWLAIPIWQLLGQVHHLPLYSCTLGNIGCGMISSVISLFSVGCGVSV